MVCGQKCFFIPAKTMSCSSAISGAVVLKTALPRRHRRGPARHTARPAETCGCS